jgi:hypothetical protein
MYQFINTPYMAMSAQCQRYVTIQKGCAVGCSVSIDAVKVISKSELPFSLSMVHMAVMGVISK